MELPFMAWARPQSHVLDNVVWSALTGPQASLAVVETGVRRFDPVFGAFIGLENDSEASLNGLKRLLVANGEAILVEAKASPVPAGIRITTKDVLVQMTADGLSKGPPLKFEIVPLTDRDGPQMLELATLTKPGPFYARTHELGDFVGVKHQGRLVAMAGERMKPDGFTEVSGVCTHPDHRGLGYAGALMRVVAGQILARGETPFLHSYAHNAGAIALYQSLGFEPRAEMLMRRIATP
jgi:predicted GNAT family acetyltransferase